MPASEPPTDVPGQPATSPGSRTPAKPALAWPGGHVALAGPAVIGRDADCDVTVSSDRASRRHARVRPGEGGAWIVEDLGSSNGTYLDGERIEGPRTLQDGDVIGVGTDVVRFTLGRGPAPGGGPLTPRLSGVVTLAARRTTIGRAPENDLVLDDPNVSRRHAEVTIEASGRARLRDLGSRNGTRVGGVRTQAAELRPGDVVGIGPFRLRFDGEQLEALDDRGALHLDARGIRIDAKGRTILQPTSLRIDPGQLVCVIGESGAGKSTLIRALGGVDRPTAGVVTVNGEPVQERRTELGFVPQDDTVHAMLTVREALTYAAKLRLPRDAGREETERSVDRVVSELALNHRADARIGTLSGGERKRVCVGVELLNRPSLLFLDEPTTGLDPGLESRTMKLLRQLADNRRAVVVVTHATQSLQLCDRIIVMGRGGLLCFDGPPAELLEVFAVRDFDDVYAALEKGAPDEWRRRWQHRRDSQPHGGDAPAPPPAAPRRRPRVSTPRQVGVLTSRYAKTFRRDRRNLTILFGQVPVIAVATALLFARDTMDRSSGDPGDTAMLLFLVVTTALWFGSIAAAREIVKERGVVARESAIGVRTAAYLASKAVVLFAVVGLQTVLLAAIVFTLRPLDEPAGVVAVVIAVLVATSAVAVGQGLAISASVDTEEQATSLVPLVLVPQLLFAGAVVPVAQMTSLIAGISSLAFSQWSFAAAGTAIGMNERIAADPAFAAASRFGGTFFDLSAGAAAAALAIFLGGYLFVAWAMLRRRAERPRG